MTDQQLDLDAIEAVIRNAAQLGADIAPETAAVMAAEIRRLRADASEQQAEIAKLIRWHGEDETAMKKMRGTISRLRAELATANACLDATAQLAGRQENKLRELGAPATVDAVEAHVVADDSDDPEPSYAAGLCTFGEGDAPGSGCILPAGHQPASRHIVTAGDADIDD